MEVKFRSNDMMTVPKWVPIDDGIQVPERSTWVAELRPGNAQGVDVEMVLVVEQRRVRVAEIHIVERGKKGISGAAVEGIPVQRLAQMAITLAADFAGVEDGDVWRGSTTLEERSRIWTATKRATRRRKTDLRLEEVADAFKSNGLQGITDLGVGERQAYRLKKDCIEAGILPQAKKGER